MSIILRKQRAAIQWRFKEVAVIIRSDCGLQEGGALRIDLDHYDTRILAELQADARLSMAELGRRVHLSQPAVTERVRKL
ncbi:AsnC family transcriptional regulator, partial [Escherichia coli]|nr:AsnC family transcriptional regulator [Escherichia coli]